MRRLLVPLVLFAVLATIRPCAATEEYAQKTGQECVACHLDPAGGGELTAAGEEYAASLASPAPAGTEATGAEPEGRRGPALKALRLVAGYLHLLIAILWFGTILYVHLVLKPQYAAGGLPKGEVRVGVLSMVVVGITGAILTYFRISSPEMLLNTRFGILLLVKVSLYLVMVLAAVFVVLVIGPRLKRQRQDAGAPRLTGSLTAEEMASCDGKEGHPAYFAYQGRVYDASDSRLWKEGVHMGRHRAGEDLTEVLDLAPHGVEAVTRLPVVGELASVAKGQQPLHVRVFYFLAYLNLSIVFIIVFIVALWRWG